MKRLNNEKGVALVMVLILASIMLAIMAALVYMMTSSTQISGMGKRYKSAVESAKGGSEVFYQVIGTRGATADVGSLLTALHGPGVAPVVSYDLGTGSCIGTPRGSTTTLTDSANPMLAKLNTATSSWSSGCNRSTVIDKNDSATYDIALHFGLGIGNNYDVFLKVVDTVEGNTGSDLGLIKSGVVTNSGEVTAVNQPYLYAIEVQSQNVDTREKAKFSVLYEY